MSNPFEERGNRGRHRGALNERFRGEKKNMQKTRAVEELKRKKQIMGDLSSLGKSNNFVDKRIGEKEQDLTEEQKAAKRFQYLRMKQARKTFSVDEGDDSITLTRHGKLLSSIGDKELMADGVSDDEELQDQLQKDLDNIDMNLPENKNRSRKEVFAEIIENHKLRKAESRQNKLQQENLLVSLNQSFKEFQSLFQMRPTRGSVEGMIRREEERKQMDDFDYLTRSFVHESRAPAQNRLKTAEELAEDRAIELEKLEKRRKRREAGLDSDEEENGGRIVDDEDKKDGDDDESGPYDFGGDEDEDRLTKGRKGLKDGIGMGESSEEEGDAEDDEDAEEEEEDGEEPLSKRRRAILKEFGAMVGHGEEDEDEEDEDEEEDGDEDMDGEEGDSEESEVERLGASEDETDASSDEDSEDEEEEGDVLSSTPKDLSFLGDISKSKKKKGRKGAAASDSDDDSPIDMSHEGYAARIAEEALDYANATSSEEESEEEEESSSEEEEEDEGEAMEVEQEAAAEDKEEESGEESAAAEEDEEGSAASADDEDGSDEGSYGVFDNDGSDVEFEAGSSADELDDAADEAARKAAELDAFFKEGMVAPEDDPMQNAEGEENLPFVFRFPQTLGDMVHVMMDEKEGCRGEPRMMWKGLHRIRAKFDTAMRLEGGQKGEVLTTNTLLFLLAAMSNAVEGLNPLDARKTLGALQAHALELMHKNRTCAISLFSGLIRRVAVRLFPGEAEELISATWRVKGRRSEEGDAVKDYEETVVGPLLERLTVGSGKGFPGVPAFLSPLQVRTAAPVCRDDVAVLHLAVVFLPVTDLRHPLATPACTMLDILAARLAKATFLPLHVPVSARCIAANEDLPQGREWPGDHFDDAIVIDDGDEEDIDVMDVAYERDEIVLRTVAALRTATAAARKYSPGLFMLLGKTITSCAARLGRSSKSVNDEVSANTAAMVIAILNSAKEAVNELLYSREDSQVSNNGLVAEQMTGICPDAAHVPCEHMLLPALVDARRRLLHCKSGRMYPQVLQAMTQLEALCVSTVRRRKLPMTLYQQRVMSIKQLDPSLLDIDDPSAARRLGQKGDPNKDEHRKLKKEVNDTRRSTARALKRDAEFVQEAQERKRQQIDRQRIAVYKREVAVFEAEQEEIRKMRTAGGSMDTSLGSHRASKKQRLGRVAGNKNDGNRRDGDKKINDRRNAVKANSRR